METVIVITTEQRNNTTPTFITPSEIVRAVVGMETVVSYNISDDDVSAGLSIVPVTMLPSGVSVDQPIVQVSDTIGEYDSACVRARACV